MNLMWKALMASQGHLHATWMQDSPEPPQEIRCLELSKEQWMEDYPFLTGLSKTIEYPRRVTRIVFEWGKIQCLIWLLNCRKPAF